MYTKFQIILMWWCFWLGEMVWNASVYFKWDQTKIIKRFPCSGRAPFWVPQFVSIHLNFNVLFSILSIVSNFSVMTCINKKLEKQICDVSFRPRSWSGGYAILITLLESEQGGIGFMRKKEITISAQRYSDTSFSTADKNSYNGWSSMSVLIKKSFVTSSNSPVKYSLTITGRKLAMEFQNQMGLMKVQNNSCHCRTIQRQESTPHMNKKLSNYNAIPERYFADRCYFLLIPTQALLMKNQYERICTQKVESWNQKEVTLSLRYCIIIR